MEALIQGVREDLLSTQDTVCLDRARLVTEAFQEWGDDPPPLRRAKTFAHILRHMVLDVDSNPIFAGNTSTQPRAWMLVPEHGFSNDTQVLIENDGLDNLFDGQIPDDLRTFWEDKSVGGCCDVGHLAVDLNRVVHDGLDAMIAEVDRHLEEDEESRRVYREAMRTALQAVIDWAGRYAEEAERAAQHATDPSIRDAHLRVAKACRQVPAKPARNLFEGLQAIALVHLALVLEGHGMSLSVGLPDRVLAPFIDDDFDAEEATQLIMAFMLKITANSIFGRGSKTQPITVGGADHTGTDQCNALTMCFLDACDRVRVGDPHVFVRWHEGLNPDVKARAADMLSRGVSMPLLIHDGPTAQGFMDAGVMPEDAWEYCVIGCNELGIPGRSAESATSRAGLVQYLDLLNQILLDHPDPDAIRSMPQLLGLLEEKMRKVLFARREQSEKSRRRVAERMPMPFTSALMKGCIRRGMDFSVGMDYHLPGLYERGVTNGVNALAAIQQMVFTDRSLTMGELVAAMRSDFEDDSVRSMLQNAPRWGSDDDCADRWVHVLLEMRERVLNKVDAKYRGPHMVCHVVRSLHYVDGRKIAASPDGRLAWTPVSDSIGAELGSASAGPIGVLNSVQKIDAAKYYRGGYNLNITLTPTEARPELTQALIEGFFDGGGQELQINCFDTGTLREAQQAPERHGDLVVRVAGFSARFVDLSRVEQDELIARAEAAA